MDWALPTIALALLAFAAVSGRLDGTPITGPMVFTAVGLLVGADTLGLVDPSVSSEAVKLLAEATLALVLFGDASRIDLRRAARRGLDPGAPARHRAAADARRRLRRRRSSCSARCRGPRRCSWP